MTSLHRRSPRGVIWIAGVAALLVAALAVWWFAGAGQRLAAQDPGRGESSVAGVQGGAAAAPPAEHAATQPDADAAATLPVAKIVRDPQGWAQQEVSGTARVAAIETERSFWIEAQGERIFAVLEQKIGQGPRALKPGQQVRLRGAAVFEPGGFAILPGDALDVETKEVLADQDVFLLVPEQRLDRQAAGRAGGRQAGPIARPAA